MVIVNVNVNVNVTGSFAAPPGRFHRRLSRTKRRSAGIPTERRELEVARQGAKRA